MRAGLVAMIALAGCASRTIRVAPGELARNSAAITRDGRAMVYASDDKLAEIRATDRVDVHLYRDNVQTAAQLTVRELVTGCDSDFKGPDCIADRVVEQRLSLRTTRSFDSDLVAKAVGFGAIAGLAGYCLAVCQDEGSVGRAFGYTAAAVAGVTLLFVLAAALGGKD